ncbi:hypothetical protein C8Q73DRAFT_802154 [Cubamyces lactineus]|nr:hypothetical protein C8Q73DRAFT_802154 [Cubamyces lactineus]
MKLSERARSAHGIREWHNDALMCGGEAVYGEPDIAVPENVRKSLQSKYVLKVLALTHLGRMTSSKLDEDYPSGALALAAMAVQRTFQSRRDDQPRGLKPMEFSSTNVREATGFWRDKAVKELLEKLHRFDQLLENTVALIETPAIKTRSPAGRKSFGPRYVCARA